MLFGWLVSMIASRYVYLVLTGRRVILIRLGRSGRLPSDVLCRGPRSAPGATARVTAVADAVRAARAGLPAA